MDKSKVAQFLWPTVYNSLEVFFSDYLSFSNFGKYAVKP